MNIWTVANQKGGVGKTTTAVTLASLLALQGRTTLLVDLDPHASASAYLLPAAPTGGAAGVSRLFDPGGAARVAELCEQTAQPGLLMLRGSPALATVERGEASRRGMGRVLELGLGELEDSVDHVIIDCPPTLGLLMVNALAAAQRVIVPVQTEHLALEGLRRMQHTLAMIERSRQAPIRRTLVATLFDQRTRAGCQALDDLRQHHAEDLWPGVIPVDTRLRDASRAGVAAPVFGPTGRAVRAYQELLDFLLDSALDTALDTALDAALDKTGAMPRLQSA